LPAGRDAAPTAFAIALRSLTARRIAREPMAYILGEREFWGLPFKVSPAVLVPRPDSETMIEAVLGLMPDRGRAWRILDLGVGSGCLAADLASGISTGKRHRSRRARTRRWQWRGRMPKRSACRHAPGLSPATGARLDGRGLDGPFDLVVSNHPISTAPRSTG
jgi:release factor glutamine methyltransferase